ncbi:hypothetical protein MBLNU459_g4332t1 [Dothideomycetes sp. NU459]
MRKSAASSFFLAVFTLLGSRPTVHASSHPTASSHAATPAICAHEPGATVSDACASYADLDALNARLNPYVRSLCTDTDFFSYYRLNLYNKVCPFWSDENGSCGNIACAVTTLENEDDIPDIWRAEELSRLEGPKAHHPGRKEQREHPEKPLMGELGEGVGESCVVEYDDECDERDYCVPEDESASAKGDYVSLVDNPERFTGYAGDGAHQVWEGIYRENCFSKPRTTQQSFGASGLSPHFGGYSGLQGQAAQNLRSVMKEHGRQQALQSGSLEDDMEFEDECLEKRVFYRVISGMHASISTHLCREYLNQTTGEWGPNLQCYKERLQRYPERISNLYFNFAFMLRAVGKLKDYAQDYTFCTGDPREDRRTKDMIAKVANAIPAGPEIFDETVMFQDNLLSETGVSLKDDFRNRFRNVSRIMDCVGCDKCRLWGKLQTAGFGTALKVLFEFGDSDVTKPKPTLRRTELVALINTLDKISHALKSIGDFEKMIEQEQESARSRADTKTGQTSKYVPDDDDFEDLDDDFFAPPPKQPKSVGDAFWEEWNTVWGAWWYVLRAWVTLPGKIWTIFVMEMARLWQIWLGLEVSERSWELRWPSLDEMYAQRNEL